MEHRGVTTGVRLDALRIGGITMSSRRRSIVDEALALYKQGWFLMAKNEVEWQEAGAPERDDEDHDQHSVAEWVQPTIRGLIPLDDRFHVAASLARRVRSQRFEVTCDEAFSDVIRACATSAPGRETTWLNDDIIALFEMFHAEGHAHSVEAWRTTAGKRVLVGGLYGVSLGRVFAGEAMFSFPKLGGTDASKVCLVHLVNNLRNTGFVALDAQMANPHLQQFGLYTITAAEYQKLLSKETRSALKWVWKDCKKTSK